MKSSQSGFSVPKHVLGVGAGALNLYLPEGVAANQILHELTGVFTPDLYQAGEKVRMTQEYRDALPAIMAHPSISLRPGGNIMNCMIYLSTLRDMKGDLIYDSVEFASVIGTEGDSNKAIVDALDRFGIVNKSKFVSGHESSYGLVERREHDRMIHGTSRGPMNEHWSDQDIKEVTKHADIMLMSSVRSAELTRRFLLSAPDGVFISLNPSGEESRTEPRQMREAMAERQVSLLVLNREELHALTEVPVDGTVSTEELIKTAAKSYAKYVVCTLGKDGMFVGHNGHVLHIPSVPIAPWLLVDVLGAGDRISSILTHELARGTDPQVAAQKAAVEVHDVLKVIGGNSDRDPYARTSEEKLKKSGKSNKITDKVPAGQMRPALA